VKKLDVEPIETDDFTMANNFEQNMDKQQEYPSLPSIDHRNSNEVPFVKVQSKRSFTEFSLNNRDQFAYQPNRNEVLKTPVFTMETNQFLMKPIPPLSFERVNKYNELHSKEDEKTIQDSVHLR
jgi:hypothetical protein